MLFIINIIVGDNMKKIIVFLFAFMIITIGINETENIIIPKDAIRFRIIANSNSTNDQKLKLTVKNDVEKELYNLVEKASTTKEARAIIENNLDKVDSILKKYDVQYEINYGNNYFPQKTYKGITYEEGNYESLVIKLGNSLGDNWWCVLFPPLCKLDKNQNLNENEYRILAYDLINNVSKK